MVAGTKQPRYQLRVRKLWARPQHELRFRLCSTEVVAEERVALRLARNGSHSLSSDVSGVRWAAKRASELPAAPTMLSGGSTSTALEQLAWIS